MLSLVNLVLQFLRLMFVFPLSLKEPRLQDYVGYTLTGATSGVITAR